MGKEYELKYQGTPAVMHRILEEFSGNFREISMETTYYDTKDRQLHANRITLRRRLENGHSICAVKTPGGEHGRGEWECSAPDIEAGIPILCDLGAPVQLRTYTRAGVEAVCGARFTRWAKTIVLCDATVELALDHGILLGGDQEIPLCEVEVELKSGPESAADGFGAALAEKFRLTPEKESKFCRAMALTR